MLRPRSDYRRGLAPYGDFICGVRTPPAAAAAGAAAAGGEAAAAAAATLLRITVSSEGSKQDPRLFPFIDAGQLSLLSLIPFSQSCRYQHAAIRTDSSNSAVLLQTTKQEGPLPAEICIFPCQSAVTPLVTCSVCSTV